MTTDTSTLITVNADESVTLPAGTYVVGDPCYSVTSGWDDFFESSQESGEIRFAVLDGFPIVGIYTEHGDGSYESNTGHTFGVDSGLIGLVPAEYVETYGEGDDTGTFTETVTFTEPVVCSYNRAADGTIKLGNIDIITDPQPQSCDQCGGPGDDLDINDICSDCNLGEDDGDD